MLILILLVTSYLIFQQEEKRHSQYLLNSRLQNLFENFYQNRQRFLVLLKILSSQHIFVLYNQHLLNTIYLFLVLSLLITHVTQLQVGAEIT